MKTGITNKLLTLLLSAITALATRAAIALFKLPDDSGHPAVVDQLKI